MSLRWYDPEFLLLFALIPLVLAYKFVVVGGLKRGGIRYPLAKRAIETGLSWRARLAFLPDLVRALVLSLVVLALMRPQWGIQREEIHRQGIDIMIVLDVSGSMAAEDFKPTRLAAAKAITERFITGLRDHRVGLVVFAGLSMTQCPLTMDYGVVTELLRRADMRMIKADGTAIGDGLINAVYKFKKPRGEKRDQIVILLTDGENNAGVVDPLEAAKIAADRGIRVYTIGVGSLEGAPIPIDTPHGRQFARNPDGSLYIPRIDEQLLKDMAYITKGQYFRATDNQALEKIYETIARLEKGKIDVSRTVQYAERFGWFLWPAFGLFVIELWLRGRVFARVF
ncbi:MAG: BatA [Candidatus Ozemobacter sibiricus]|jgi:Ca-activated chloride channel family protein|uniref:BatA n=1 Tax=Candidatus Ozemobacter sibiricus TaxID=2268124 RepID=A0A367ZRQ0_9BACT|nr:MAG: BatA [Candidatus Ozemobacter sibiricus]